MIRATLIDHMGDDLRVANAARVSFDKESKWVQRVYSEEEGCPCGASEPSEGWPCSHGSCGFGPVLTDEEVPASYEPYEDWPLAFDDKDRELSSFMLSAKDAKLISYLARHNHWTPFSHPQITLREEVPIFVARQRFKHMVGFTYNEVSRRYVDDVPEFFQPETWRQRADNLKQGSLEEPAGRVEFYVEDSGLMDQPAGALHDYIVSEAFGVYQAMLKAGVAPEQARMVLPQSMMTSYYVTGSLAAFARAYKQRSDSHSQKEIRDLAAQWDQIIRPLFPVSWAALVS